MKRVSEHKRLCATKDGRAKLVECMQAIALAHGATFKLSEVTWSPRDIGCTISLGDYRVNMHFDGASTVDAFLAHWFRDTSSQAKYPAHFGAICGGSVNNFHFGKATTCTDTFEEFRERIGAGLAYLKSILDKAAA